MKIHIYLQCPCPISIFFSILYFWDSSTVLWHWDKQCLKHFVFYHMVPWIESIYFIEWMFQICHFFQMEEKFYMGLMSGLFPDPPSICILLIFHKKRSVNHMWRSWRWFHYLQIGIGQSKVWPLKSEFDEYNFQKYLHQNFQNMSWQLVKYVFSLLPEFILFFFNLLPVLI